MLAHRALLLLPFLSATLASTAPGRRTSTPATLLPRDNDSDECSDGFALCSEGSCYPLDGSTDTDDRREILRPRVSASSLFEASRDRSLTGARRFTCQTDGCVLGNGAAGAHPAAAGTLAGLLAVGAAFALA
ncbi:uncharacterized protein BXZ73DRAFT_78956 [Epithele typhae]|uniref:uncharacterized protein n=1 Tax=Epithele typhae TaxID=378194 RepID=UPI0020087A86|nr:uncharacterized protein BXZ73DRAFT_78956 [Epithele typhae]KAH9925616.1 hypothetical protein BXZ73DRAFT_78956 [Epithele typhae]